MSAGHDHTHGQLGPRLLVSMLINVAIVVVQFIGGVLSGSLALMADALHNLSDVISLALSYGAYRIAQRPASRRYTFAFQRAEVLAAGIAGLALIAVSAYIAVEAIQRLGHPEPVAGGLVVVFAAFGIVANGIAAWILRGNERNLNIRAAMLHLVSDVMASVGVLIAGALVRLFGWYFIDPLVSLALAAWMTVESIRLLSEAARILMQGVPDTIELGMVESAIEDTPGVAAVHDLRVWAVSPTNVVLSAHLVVDDGLSRSETVAVVHAVKVMLHDRFGVEHATLETEGTEECAGIITCEE